MKRAVRLVLLGLLIAAGVWLYTVFFPAPEKVIRKQLTRVARLASITPDQSLLSRGASIQELANCFDSQVEITLNSRSGPEQITGRDGIIETAKLAHTTYKRLRIDFLDMNVTLAPDKQSATVNLTAKATSSEEMDFQVQEFKITLKKVNGEWLIIRIEAISTLSRARTGGFVFVNQRT
jgi:hypothetical protein